MSFLRFPAVSAARGRRASHEGDSPGLLSCAGRSVLAAGDAGFCAARVCLASDKARGIQSYVARQGFAPASI